MTDSTNSNPNLTAKTEEKPMKETVASTPKMDSKKTSSPSKFAALLKEIEKMNIQDLNAFVKDLQAHFDITPMAAVASSAQDEKATVPDKVSVVITEAGQSKVALIKAIGSITGKGLMDSKKILDQIPATIVSDKSASEAADIQKQLEEAGATVQLK